MINDLERVKLLLKMFLSGNSSINSVELVTIAQNMFLLKEEVGMKLLGKSDCSKRDLKNFISSKPSALLQVMATEKILEGLVDSYDLRFLIESLPECKETKTVKEKIGHMLLKEESNDQFTAIVYSILKYIPSLAGKALEIYLAKYPDLSKKELFERLGLNLPE